jgi:hypothetical protein
MTSKPMFPKRDPKRKKKSGFHSFTEEEFEACLEKLVEEDRDVLIAPGKN